MSWCILRCIYGRNEHVKKNIFLCHSVCTFSGKKCTSSNFFFFSLFFSDLRKQVEQVISFYIHFSSSHFLLLFFFIFHFLSKSKEDEQYIQHIYWKVIYVHAPLHKCITILSNQWRFIYVVGIISRFYTKIQFSHENLKNYISEMECRKSNFYL